LLFDTPVLHTNNVSIYETRPLKPVDRLMYKKIFSKRMQRNLNIREFVNLRLDSDVVLEDENYSFEENSANELLLATREMMNPSSVQIDWTKQSMLKGMIKENNYVQKGRTSSSERPLDKLNYYRFLVRHEMSDCLIASDYLSSNW
jgi:putative glycosyltransferase (TIGR04372 family)